MALALAQKTTNIDYVLIIASSGRMLAQAAKQAGYASLVIDLYADQDTEALAEKVCRVDDLSLARVRITVESLAKVYAIKCVVYGSGLEFSPETLSWLAVNLQLKGNESVVLQQFSNKEHFFRQLKVLQICYPEVCFSKPRESSGWLLKSMQSAGGVGVRRADSDAGANEYYQRFCVGEVGSVLFCANGKQAQVIGFHRQWAAGRHDFTFAGIMRAPILPKRKQQQVQEWLERLVAHYQLQGLGSLDFIWDGRQCYFLELNARPPASMSLYPELDLFTAHLTGQVTILQPDTLVRGLQIVFARKRCHIKQIQWPQWSYDRPKIQTEIMKGEPVCSIMAQGMTVQQLEESLLEKQQFIENNIY